ncbi:hypothetical protein FN846DRAFT_757616, partial [Sphaerosporella brunnea]
ISESGFTIEHLSDGNYSRWSMRMRDILMAKGVWEVVDGTDTDPSLADGKVATRATEQDRALAREIREYRQRVMKAASTIRLGLDDSLAVRYSDDTFSDPKLLWDTLKTDQEAVVRHDEEYLESTLFDVKLEECGSVRSYVNRI